MPVLSFCRAALRLTRSFGVQPRTHLLPVTTTEDACRYMLVCAQVMSC